MEHAQTSDELVGAFGVGCFHFGYKQIMLADKLDIESYVAGVRDFLSAYPNIEEVEIPSFQYLCYASEYVFEPRGPDSGGDPGTAEFLNLHHIADPIVSDCEPVIPSDWQIDFTVHIPDRVQEELWREYRRHPFQKGVQKYRVSLVYENYLPVVFVFGENGTPRDPSYLIILIREYLKRFAPSESEIEFQVLGPSPFHADFFVSSSLDHDHHIQKREGYDDLYFNLAGTEKFETDIARLKINIANELGLYYYLVRARTEIWILWRKFLENFSDALNQSTHEKSFGQRVYELFSLPRMAPPSIELIQYELLIEEKKLAGQKELSRLKAEANLEYFLEYTQEVIQELSEIPIDKYRGMSDAITAHNRSLDTYRMSASVALIGFVAACIGGIVGALSAVFLSSPP